MAESASARGRRASLDLICIFSCLCVTIVHFNASISGWNGAFIHPQNSLIPSFYLGGRVYLGSIGVSLFFMLSGARQMLSYRGGVRRFFTRRVLRLYPMFWIAFSVATAFDFLRFKGMSGGNPLYFLLSLSGMDGYLASLGLTGMPFYKLGEWFFGCILCLYVLFPLLRWGVSEHPAATVLLCLGVYAACVHRVSELLFVVRIPEMLFGMCFVRYRMEERPAALLLMTAAALLAAWLFRSAIAPLTLCIALCLLLFAAMVCLSHLIRNEAVKRALAAAAALTYPVFLVHHWLIERLLMGFDLSYMPRRNVLMMFAVFMALTIALSVALMRAEKKVMGAAHNAWTALRHPQARKAE